MNVFRATATMTLVFALISLLAMGSMAASPGGAQPTEVLRAWYKLALALVRHTPTYSPPVASRSFAYLGVTAFEAVASGDARLHSLAGQLNGLPATPPREVGQTYNESKTWVLMTLPSFSVSLG